MRMLVAPGNGVTSFIVWEFPAGNTSFIRIGQNGQRIPVQALMEWVYDPACGGPEMDGIVWEQPAIGGGVATVVLFMGGGAAGVSG